MPQCCNCVSRQTRYPELACGNTGRWRARACALSRAVWRRKPGALASAVLGTPSMTLLRSIRPRRRVAGMHRILHSAAAPNANAANSRCASVPDARPASACEPRSSFALAPPHGPRILAISLKCHAACRQPCYRQAADRLPLWQHAYPRYDVQHGADACIIIWPTGCSRPAGWATAAVLSTRSSSRRRRRRGRGTSHPECHGRGRAHRNWGAGGSAADHGGRT